jgi:hypothetical protein
MARLSRAVMARVNEALVEILDLESADDSLLR